jgi:hypothetical protein
VPLDLRDGAAARRAVAEAADALGGLDALVVATGAVAFGRRPSSTTRSPRAVRRQRARPLALVSAALQRIEGEGAIVALSASSRTSRRPGWRPTRRQGRPVGAPDGAAARGPPRSIAVVDVRRRTWTRDSRDGRWRASPRPAEGFDEDALVETVLEAMRAGRREVTWDLKARALAVS